MERTCIAQRDAILSVIATGCIRGEYERERERERAEREREGAERKEREKGRNSERRKAERGIRSDGDLRSGEIC